MQLPRIWMPDAEARYRAIPDSNGSGSRQCGSETSVTMSRDGPDALPYCVEESRRAASDKAPALGAGTAFHRNSLTNRTAQAIQMAMTTLPAMRLTGRSVALAAVSRCSLMTAGGMSLTTSRIPSGTMIMSSR